MTLRRTTTHDATSCPGWGAVAQLVRAGARGSCSSGARGPAIESVAPGGRFAWPSSPGRPRTDCPRSCWSMSRWSRQPGSGSPRGCTVPRRECSRWPVPPPRLHVGLGRRRCHDQPATRRHHQSRRLAPGFRRAADRWIPRVHPAARPGPRPTGGSRRGSLQRLGGQRRRRQTTRHEHGLAPYAAPAAASVLDAVRPT